MTPQVKKTLIGALSGVLVPGMIYVIALLHVAWADDNYVQKDEARLEQIEALDVQLAVKDTEILFAANEREKEKLRAIKAIYERKKQALMAKSRD